MEKPTARGPSPNRKAELALFSKLNRKDKPPPPLPRKLSEQNSISPSPLRRRIDNSL